MKQIQAGSDMRALDQARSADLELTSRLLAHIQVHLDYRARRSVAAAAAEACRRKTPTRFGGTATAARGAEMLENGLVSMGPVLSPVQIKEIRDFLSTRPLRKGHVFQGKDPHVLDPGSAAKETSHACYSVLDVLACPHLIELANSPSVLAVAESYLGCAPTLYSLNAFWTFPDHQTVLEGVQTFHRDWDDFRFCTLFVFLTDTSADNGVHEYVCCSHDQDTLRRWLDDAAPGAVSDQVFEALFQVSANVDALFPAPMRDLVAEISGPAGTAMMEDTSGLHRGISPRQPRLLFWARYGLYANKSYFDDGQVLGGIDPAQVRDRIPIEDDYYAFVNRLLLRSQPAR